jgi:hypothetical protein
MPIRGQRIKTAKPVTIIKRTLEGMPYRKNSLGVKCFES